MLCEVKTLNLVETLLAADQSTILAAETVTYEVKRLSKLLDCKFELTLQAIPARRYGEIQTSAIAGKGKKQNVDLYKLQIMTAVAGVVSPDFNNPELLKKFSAVTPKELMEKLFNAGEISAIADKISALFGFDEEETKEATEEVKN